MTPLDRLVALAARGEPHTRRPPAASRHRITNAADRATVQLYGEIGWDVLATDVARYLAGIDAPNIDVHINSPGGSVFDAIAIHAALRNHPATITTHVDGVAASAASFIAMAGDERVIEKPAKMMIHDASGLVLGGAADMRQMADLLDEMSDTIANIYADRAGGTVESWRDAMRAETWYSSSQAVAAGLADRIANDTTAPDNRRSQLIRARARAMALKG